MIVNITKDSQKIANLKDQSLSNKMSLFIESGMPWTKIYSPTKNQHAMFPKNTDRAVKSAARDQISNPPDLPMLQYLCSTHISSLDSVHQFYLLFPFKYGIMHAYI